MPSWREIQDYARSKYKLSKDEDQYFALIFSYDNDRSQQIFVRRFEAFDQECVEFRAAVCKEEEMSPVVALRKNSEFALGALVLVDNMYTLIYNAVLTHLDLEEFELPLHVLSRSADHLEKNYSSGDDTF